ncbi:unnamed protein product [Brassica napus]|uniref:(rape) hypothetical protein n=1 Tax=Brassica napus TaxID=3708 RepID=A0A816JWZ8_BRANA|nr:unnamed protein product [Brassica napus]
MFDDQDIERSPTIAPSLTKAIIESRISIVILSQKYASSGWCLDELVEILEDNEAKMIKKIAKDVLDKLNVTPSKDFDGMEGLGAHLKEMQLLLDLHEDDGVKLVAISGPAGIGKTTIARALHSLIRDRFQLTCFVENRKGSYPAGLDDYERLGDKRVLIILDDVDNIRKLEALANETTWFGSGSRIVVTTENKELLQKHCINNTYHVGFPSDVEAIDILRKYAFRKRYPQDDFEVIAERITELCVFFNYKDGDLVKAISADADHLERMARQVIRKQKPWKRQLVLVNADEICGVLENETGTGVVSGISFDVSNGASSSSKVPPTFHPGYLVEVDMTCSQLEIPLAGSSGYSGSFKCYKFGDVKSERVPEIGRDSVLLFASS